MTAVPSAPDLLDAFPSETHDHDACRDAALRRAEALCADRGERLTPLRRQVLDILWRDHRPLSAYDVLALLNAGPRAEAAQKPAAPPTVYRALDFLVAQGLAHRITSLNAYVGCPDPETPHGAQFFICRSCQAVAEVGDPTLSRDIERIGAGLGFLVDAPVVEVEGLCPHCRPDPAR